MLIYNQLTELILMQAIIIIGVGVAAIVMQVLVSREIPRVLFLLLALGVGLEISLFTLLIGNGNYGGMAFHEKFGWPIQYLTVSRHIDPEFGVAQVYAKNFDFVRFGINTLYWALVPMIIVITLTSERKKNRLALLVIPIIIGATLLYCAQNKQLLTRILLEENSFMQAPTTISPFTAQKLAAIEKEYPMFKDYTQQSSFAGASIVHEAEGTDEYFVFMAHGSGRPIVQATCFRVDRLFRAYKIGEFPDPLDSYYGYDKIDPKTCQGIK